MKKPNPCPDSEYVNNKLVELLNSQLRLGDNPIKDGSILRYVKRMNIAKFLAHYEIYKLVKDLPGHIVELGVFKGESLLRFSQFTEIFEPYDRSFRVIGFDNFNGFEGLNEKDGEIITDMDKVVGGWSSKKNREELFELINVYDNDRFIPQKQKIQIVEGDILKTVPKFYNKNKNIKIRLLHLDADLYEPTLVGLKYFWDLLIPGGVLLLDEYAFDGFIGESVAVDEFFKKNKIVPNFQKIKTSDNPGAFLIKKNY